MKGMSRVSCIDDVPRRNERGQRIAVLVPLLHYIVLLLLLCRRDELTLTTVTAFAFQQPRYMLHPRGTATLGSSTRRFSVSPPTSNPPTREDKATTATPSGTAKRLDLSSIERRSDEEMFDPFDFPSTKMMEPVDIASHMILATNKEEQAKNEELGIWAARALLLLVAMIWGTNFAVRAGLCAFVRIFFVHSSVVCCFKCSLSPSILNIVLYIER